MPGKACKHYIHYIHGVWIPAIHAGMTLLLKHLYNQEIRCLLGSGLSGLGITTVRYLRKYYNISSSWIDENTTSEADYKYSAPEALFDIFDAILSTQ